MNLVKGKTDNEFNLEGVTFNQLVIIKKACGNYAQQGSQPAAEVVKQLDDAMNNTMI